MNTHLQPNPSNSPLAHSHLQVDIVDLVAEYELRHVFRNAGKEPIEAVYSFPVPLDRPSWACRRHWPASA